MKIAFIGLGNMGGGMAANLVKAGHEVNAFDLSEEALAAARDNGCTTFTDASEAVQGVDGVVSMLPNGEIVKSVYEGSVIGKAPKAQFCSTARRSMSPPRRGHRAGRGCRIRHGRCAGVGRDRRGQWRNPTFMVGGTDKAFARAEDVLNAMGKAVIHAGDAGGPDGEICNNMLLAISMIGTAEAMKMAEKLGLDPQKFYEISSQSSGYCWSLNAYTPLPGVGVESPADKDYQGGFATGLMLKDLKLAMDAAQTADAATPLGRHAKELYEQFAEDNAGLDFSAIIRSL